MIGEIRHGLALAQWFVDQLQHVSTEAELKALMEEICVALGFRYFALIHHCDLRFAVPGLVNINNYPPVWRDYFIERILYRVDPVVHACGRTTAAFLWSQLDRLIYLNALHRDILRGGAREGIGDGLTIPATVTGERSGSCSFSGPRSGAVLERNFLIGQVIGAFGFEAARQIASGDKGMLPTVPILNTRQRDCTVLAGRGLKDLAIAAELGLSYKTVTHYLAAARARYHVPNREQLIVRAIVDGTIHLAELDTRQ